LGVPAVIFCLAEVVLQSETKKIRLKCDVYLFGGKMFISVQKIKQKKIFLIVYNLTVSKLT
jgi:hypothetical protein